MKKMYAFVVMLFGLAGYSYAGVALDQGFAPATYNAFITGSSATATTSNLSVSIAPPSVGGSASNCRNCFTKFVIQEGTYTITSILDAGTTVYTIDGVGLGSSGTNTIALPEDHLGPLCLTAGNTTTINAVNTNALTGAHTVINYEGYSECGTSRNRNQ